MLHLNMHKAHTIKNLLFYVGRAEAVATNEHHPTVAAIIKQTSNSNNNNNNNSSSNNYN